MRLYTICLMLACLLQAQGADKYTDENRPYEFGFTIDGEQHRHEKKDENGIIMGEFGFITADGVYHVTVYATDENGNFKILSMKNIRKKPYPTSPANPTRHGNSLPFPPSQNPPQTRGPTAVQQSKTTGQQSTPVVQQPRPTSPVKSCGSCSIPVPSTQAPAALTDFANVANSNGNFQPDSPSGPNQYKGVSSSGNQVNSRPSGVGPNYLQNRPQGGILGNSQGGPASNYPQSRPGSVPGSDFPQSGVGSNYPQRPGSNQPENSKGLETNYNQPQQGFGPNINGQNGAGGPGQNQQRNPKRIDDYPQNENTDLGSHRSSPQKPTLISAQMQIVDKNTDIYRKNPGEKDGLPQGLNKDDMVQLLYTFNYTVGFHAHFEEGYTNGAKQGYYYVTGRNGIRTRIDYVADEKGFRPKITEEVLDLISDDVPKPETEKDEKYGLKGYEFKWLYYPIESKRQ